MKRILLIGLLMFSASLLDAMTNPAVMLKASALLRRNLQIVDAHATIEHRADGTTFVHYLRNDQEMVVFNADLLKKSGTITDMFEDIGSSDQIIVAIVKQLFDRLTGIEQIKLAVQALDANNPSLEQASFADSVKQFIDQLQSKDLAWLSNWTDEWALEFVYNALMPQLASDRNVAFDFYNRGLINDVVARYVSDKINMSDVSDSLFSRLGRELVPPKEEIWSAAYNSDGSIILAGNHKVMLYDFKSNLIQSITLQLEPGEFIHSALSNKDGSEILVATRNEAMTYDFRGNLITTIILQLEPGESISKALYSPDGSQILITTADRLMMYDSQGNLIRLIIPLLQHDDRIRSAGYSPDGSHILVASRDRVMIYDLRGNLITSIDFQLESGKWIESVVYSPDGLRILLATDKKMMIYDFQNKKIQLITPQLQQNEWIRAVSYSPDGLQILVKTGSRVRIYDLQGNLIKQLIPLKSQESIQSAVYSPDGSQILVVISRMIGRMIDFNRGARMVHRVMIYPNMSLKQLDLAQKQFLIKASEAWKANGPYIVGDNELDVYKSLPEILKDKRLFVVIAGGCPIS